MPIYIADPSIDPVSLQTVPEKYLIFYASVVDGKMWCPDCVDVDPLIQEAFSGEDKPGALLVYVGNRTQWKTPSNIFRQAPWKVTGVPAIVKVKDGHPGERIVEGEITRDRLAEFVKAD
ncbi:hypothetical protein CC1G_06545 [Coprinopsis cinerea okayama7|uniref:Thioredoxin domain-containing protein n=1 Tax=Coprinopsis cinerea (strain Okayama-7 / 130 / ATCC MYA-4618 / FGSC 9003) TaxID=240176 RepID=A8N336_COPC7|nr:hypothetical protein CC1G_06545 [Coprinopsis cinerea okayama7\|eukprot:XP_001829208.1 hypothetical protein CC1G_06545 [Coprinopsis cinerea okayama7\